MEHQRNILEKEAIGGFMWERSDLKQQAKQFLSKNYLKAFVVSIVIFVVTNGVARGNNNKATVNYSMDNFFSTFDLHEFVWIFFGVTLMAFLVIAVVFIFLRVVLGYALIVGARRFYIDGTNGSVGLDRLKFSFEKDRFFPIAKAMFYRDVINFLYFLLLIIPGIIKAYAFSMVPYILADNPNIGTKRAVELSTQMTEGHKFNIFILDLSFIGWYILATFFWALGIHFLNPYIDATKAQLYLVLRDESFKKNFTTPHELGVDVSVEQSEDNWYHYES